MMKTLCTILILLFCFVFYSSLTNNKFTPAEDKPEPIPKSIQRTGDAAKGYDYLTTGNYVKGGIPYDFFMMAVGKDNKKLLPRTGLNAKISYEYTVVKASNGENLVAPNCLQCHAQIFNDSLYIGMGNTFIDFSSGQKINTQKMDFLERMLKTTAPRKYAAAANFIQVSKTIAPKLGTAVRGVNAADRLAAVLVSHRDMNTFAWSDTAMMQLPDEVIPSDVPAWWLLKKKNAMFYNGFGRGDFGKFLMASNLLTVKDTSEANEVDKRISDVLAYLYTLEAPKYPKAIDQNIASTGEAIFINSCAKCHGSYGYNAEYPNLLIPSNIIKTDSALFKSNYQNPQFVNWFNNSWFSKGDHPAMLVPYNGYIAPPLDGIWATSPYLHNGSVPTIEAVLNSKLRPKYWERNFDTPEYDFEKLGWKYVTKDKPGGSTVYNTDLKGYRNHGHTFGDKLSEVERKAVIEYLKKL